MNAFIDITGVELYTPRLVLRPWRENDLEDFYAYASVDGVGQMAGWTPHKSIEESQKILNSFIAHKRVFALEYQGRVIGSLGVEEYDEAKYPELSDQCCRELGFVLAKEFWGVGLMPEAVRAVIAWLFTEKKMDAILCAHFDWNTQSARVQQKCGFRPYAEGTCHTFYGTVEREIVNILTRGEWEAVQ